MLANKETISTLMDSTVSVLCADGMVFCGKMIGWTSALDNEPDGESILINSSGILTEIFVDDIEDISVAS